MPEDYKRGHYLAKLNGLLPKKYFRRAPERLWWLLPHLGLITAGFYAITALNLNIWANLAISLVIGHSFACLGFLAHEVLHGTVVRPVWLQEALGVLCFAPFLLGPRLWRKWHNIEHHGHTQHGEDDPDAMATWEQFQARPELQKYYSLAPFLRSFLLFAGFSVWFSVHSLLMLRRYYGELEQRDRRAAITQLAIPTAVWFALLLWFGPLNFVFAYIVPLLAGNFLIMSYIATNHLLNPLSDSNDPLVTSLSLKVPTWLDVIHLRFSHHTEHHVFPNMSSKYAPYLKTELKRLWPDRYHEMPHWQAMLTLWRTPRIYHGHDELYDPKAGLAYGSLGRGLNPDKVAGRSLDSGMED